MNKIVYCICLSCFNLMVFAQELDWLKKSTSNVTSTSHRFYTSTQHNGDFYFAGDFWKDLTIDGVNIEIREDSANGFIVKMDRSGTASFLWHLESNGYVRINKMMVNHLSKSLIVTGYYRTDLIFNDEIWTAGAYSNSFVMSINVNDGTLNWNKILEPQTEVSFALGAALAIDEMGSVFVGVEAAGTVNIENQSLMLESGPESLGVIILKIDANGNFLDADVWDSQGPGGWIDINDMAIDSDNHLVTVGGTTGTIEVADSNFIFSKVSRQPFIIKQDNNLNFQWLKTYQSRRCHVLDVYVDEKDLILSLQYNGSIDVDGGILTGSGSWGDMAVISINENAELKWAKNFTLSQNSGNYGVYGNAIVGWMDQYYIGGLYQGDVVHEGSLILDNRESRNTYQYPFIISLDKNGTFTSAYDFVGSIGPGKINSMSANESHLLFGGDFSERVSIGGASVNTINSTLFYGALTTGTTRVEVTKDEAYLISIYPTISSDYLAVETEAKIVKFHLISSIGVLLKEFSGDTRVIDVNDLASGLYYLLAEMDGKIISAKFIKQ